MDDGEEMTVSVGSVYSQIGLISSLLVHIAIPPESQYRRLREMKRSVAW